MLPPPNPYRGPVPIRRTQIQVTNQVLPHLAHRRNRPLPPTAPAPHDQVLSSLRLPVGGAPRAGPWDRQACRDVTSARAWPRCGFRGPRGGTEVVAVEGGGAGGRGAQVRTSNVSRAASPDPAAHREAKPTGWAAEPESGTGEARAEQGCRVCKPGMRGGESQASASLTWLVGRPEPEKPPTVAVGTLRPAREGLAATRCKEGAGWLGSLMGVRPALGIRIRNSGVGGWGVYASGLGFGKRMALSGGGRKLRGLKIFHGLP